MSAGTVIVGAGQAGAQLAMSLREAGYLDDIALIGDEAYIPYHRPPLSKDFMAGGLTEAELPIRAPSYYQQENIRLCTGTRAISIDRHSQHVVLATGEALPYQHLVLATGARNRTLPFGRRDPSNVHYLRTYDDAQTVRDALARARNVLIVGAGFIGLEFASVAAGRAARVTVVEMAERVMERAVSEEVSAHFAARHAAAGVDVLCSTTIDEFLQDEDGRVTSVRFGTQVREVDIVLVGIGVIPNSELARDAGLAVDNGIIVDSDLSTSDPAIFAIGDCARHPRPETSGLVRVESVQNAADQARFLARRLTGTLAAYADVPWFWSRQAGDKLQIAGLSQPGDGSVVVGDPTAGRFSVCRTRAGRLVAVESVNSPGDHLASRRLLEAGIPVAERQLHAPDFSFRSLTAGHLAKAG